MEPLIKAQGMTVVYNLGKTSEYHALFDINLEIYPGEFVIFFGPSGCGKSTLLNCIAGFQKLSKGDICIKGKKINELRGQDANQYRRQNMGMVFQSYNLIPSLRVLDNVVLPKVLGGEYLEDVENKAKSMLEKFGILNYQGRYPAELSGGQQQRVAIARSLMYDPPILLCDEPVGSLDSESARIVMDLLAKLNTTQQKTIILVTHDIQYLTSAHRIFYLNDGKIVRVVKNTARQQISSKEEGGRISETFGVLTKIFPTLPESRLKAKALAQYLITPFGVPELERLEEILEKRINNKISEKELGELLDLPSEKGGLGLYSQTARNFSKQIEDILSEAKLLETKVAPLPLKTSIESKVERIRKSILDEFSVGVTSYVQLERLDKFITQRIRGEISKKQFVEFLDLPIARGGIGLNKRTAKNFSRKLELIIAL